MRSRTILKIAGSIIAAGLLGACGVDRSGEYYALISTQTWMYETMQQNYLFYQDLPEESGVNFFTEPSSLLNTLASSQDKKNGTTFSHIDSVYSSKAISSVPTFGFEGALVRIEDGSYGIRVLYTQENSPASEAGLKRGDWIIAANNKKINSTDYDLYIGSPSQAYNFTMGNYNGTGFDTLKTVQMPAPRLVEIKNLYKWQIISQGSRKAAYIMYNEFGDDSQELKDLFSQLAGQQFNDIILDLRYNPGGYVNISQLLSTNIAPQEAIGQPFLKMTYNDKINKTDVLNFESDLLVGGKPLSYDNLYIITSGNTASASEIVINCLKPYLNERLLQVGTATYGKNLAQQLFTDSEKAPMIEFWLTTSRLSNSKDFSDYFENGLQPDFNVSENLGGTLGELGSAQDSLMIPILKRMESGSFPSTGESDNTTTRMTKGIQVISNSISFKPKTAKF